MSKGKAVRESCKKCGCNLWKGPDYRFIQMSPKDKEVLRYECALCGLVVQRSCKDAK